MGSFSSDSQNNCTFYTHTQREREGERHTYAADRKTLSGRWKPAKVKDKYAGWCRKAVLRSRNRTKLPGVTINITQCHSHHRSHHHHHSLAHINDNMPGTMSTALWPRYPSTHLPPLLFLCLCVLVCWCVANMKFIVLWWLLSVPQPTPFTAVPTKLYEPPNSSSSWLPLAAACLPGGINKIIKRGSLHVYFRLLGRYIAACCCSIKNLRQRAKNPSPSAKP